MSDMQDFSAFRDEGSSSQENIQAQPNIREGERKALVQSINDIEEALDGKSYFIGEVPQLFLVDPRGFLPLNSDRLLGANNAIETMIRESELLMQEEVNKIQALQRKVNFWEDKIEKNKALIASKLEMIKQNNIDIIYDKKNRDYWWVRAEEVANDYASAEAVNRLEDWLWLIKKYGLKNTDGSPIDSTDRAFEELCNGSANNLIGEYKNAGEKYEQSRRNKEAENMKLLRESGCLKRSNDTLQGYVSFSYTKEIEPLQQGVFLFKELNVKLKSLSQDSASTYGDLRVWAESFINDFIKANSLIPQSVVTDFRRLASIPLPAENC